MMSYHTAYECLHRAMRMIAESQQRLAEKGYHLTLSDQSKVVGQLMLALGVVELDLNNWRSESMETMSAEELKIEIIKINSLLDLPEELLLSDACQSDLASYRDQLRERLKELDSRGFQPEAS